MTEYDCLMHPAFGWMASKQPAFGWLAGWLVGWLAGGWWLLHTDIYKIVFSFPPTGGGWNFN